MIVLIVLCSQIDVIIIIIIFNTGNNNNNNDNNVIIIIIVIKVELFLTKVNTVNALFVSDALRSSDQWCI